MKIILGLGYDNRHPIDALPRLGTVVCGERGFVQELETRCGLVCPRQSIAERTVIYLKALRAINNPERFFQKSFLVDPVSSATTLLGWRDWAFLHGWNGDACAEGRLSDLSDAEKEAVSLSPSDGERLRALLSHTTTISASVTDLILHDDTKSWPFLYQELFRALEEAGVVIRFLSSKISAHAEETTDLGSIQRALLSNMRGEQGGRVELKGDRTFSIYRVKNQQAGGAFLCEQMLASSSHTLIASNSFFQLNSSAAFLSTPEPGLGERSFWRAPQRLLPLLINVAWQIPLAEDVLEYLTLPAGPFRKLRNRIARLFTDLPGIQNHLWKQEIDKYIKEVVSEKPQTDELKIGEEISNWLFTGKSEAPGEMTTRQAMGLAEQVAAYWRKTLAFTGGNGEGPVFSAALEFALAFGQALREWPEQKINKVQLNRLLDMAADTGSVPYTLPRAVSSMNIVTDHSVCRLSEKPSEHLYWWGIQSLRGEDEPPFTSQEMQCIPFAPDESRRADMRKNNMYRAIRPLLSAGKSALILVLDEGPDILRLQLANVLGMETFPLLDEALLEGKVKNVKLEKVKPLNLPPRLRWWNIKEPVPSPREVESYSSLVSSALRPHEYALHYFARISAGSLLTLAVDARLLGNLAHKVVERWFEDYPWDGSPPEASVLKTWLRKTCQSLIIEFGLPLEAPGRRVEKIAFIEKMNHALQSLLDHLHNAGVTVIEIEKNLDCRLAGVTLEGRADILALVPGRGWVIIDVKWGGQAAREKDLREGLYLQLATYARLAATLPSGKVASVANFILRSGEMIAHDNSVFQKAKKVPLKSDFDTFEKVWKDLEKTWQWRMGQLGKGNIEVTYGGEAPTDVSFPPEGALPVIEIEKGSMNNKGSYFNTFKFVNPWIVLAGEIEG